MTKRILTRLGIGLACLVLPFAGPPAWGQLSKDRPDTSVRLVPSVESIVPGVPFDLALHFRLERGWHIYWQNSGESGMPPRPTWTLPQGFALGPMRFPVPKRHVDPGPIVTNVLEGEPTILIEATPPEQLDADSVRLAADVVYLICADTCLRETAKVEVELPVNAAGAPITPANQELFRRARASLPKAKSKYVTISASPDPREITPGATFELVVEVDIADGFVLPAPQPQTADPMGTDLFLARTDGVFWDETSYPDPNKGQLGKRGTVSYYADRFTIRAAGEVDTDASGPFHFGGVLVFQPCDSTGSCEPVEAVAFSTGRPPALDRGRVGAATAPPDQAGEMQAGDAADTAVADAGVRDTGLGTLGLFGVFLGCFLYGLFINATPCVLPLLSIKVLGFVQQAHQSRAKTMALGLAFGAGVMVLFVILGFLASQGTNVLQYPAAIIGLGAVVLALALSMLGVYTLQVPTAATKLEASLHKEGLFTSFGKGALAPVLGFACTAPFMAGMFGLAAKQPPLIAFFAFLVAGFGMAFPYMLLGANPHWLGFLPKPGHWMITFERIMGFLLLAMVVWLVHPLSNRVGVAGLEWTLVFYVAVAMACWIIGQVDLNMSTMHRWAYRGGAVAFLFVVGGLIYEVIYPLDEASERASAAEVPATVAAADTVGPYCPIPFDLWDPRTAATAVCKGDPEQLDFSDVYREVCRANFDAVWKNRIPWQPWSQDDVKRALESGWIAFVDFTADTCTVCKSNKKIATNTEEVRQRMKALGVVPFLGDFSDGDSEIFAMLQKFNRIGVPLNLIYTPDRPDDPIVLRTNLTKEYLLEKLDQAASMQTASAAAKRTAPAAKAAHP